MICSTCSKPLTRPPSQTFKNNFCNHGCYSKYKAKLFTGSNNPRWTGGNNVFACKVCGKKSARRKTGEVKPKFCSLVCYHKDKSEQMAGEKHWNWKGGLDTRYMRKLAPRKKPDACEVCGAKGSDFKKGLVYDHCHKTGKFRGWLCSNCNTALGLTKDNPEILQRLIKYLSN